ncbi:MAG: hypothetical protein V4553_13030 [Bacteroidota bacterium]
MKILKAKKPFDAKMLAKFVNDNQIAREDIFSIVADPITAFFTIFYYEEPKPEEDKKGFWG